MWVRRGRPLMGHDGWRGKKCWQMRGKKWTKGTETHHRVVKDKRSLDFFKNGRNSKFRVFWCEYSIFAFICRQRKECDPSNTLFLHFTTGYCYCCCCCSNANELQLKGEAGSVISDTSAKLWLLFSLWALSLTFRPAHTVREYQPIKVTQTVKPSVDSHSETLLAEKKTTWPLCTDWVAGSGFMSSYAFLCNSDEEKYRINKLNEFLPLAWKYSKLIPDDNALNFN